MGRVLVLVSALAAAAFAALAPALAEAQQARPVERSVTAQTQSTPLQPARPATAAATPAPRPAQGGFLQRNPFLGAVLGGFIGAGFAGLLSGGSFFGAGIGVGGTLGVILQLGLIYLVVRFIAGLVTRKRANAAGATGRYAYATDRNARYVVAQSGRGPQRIPPTDLATSRAGATPAASLALRDEVGIKPTDYAEFEKLLVVVQKAWSSADAAMLAHHLTPELLSYFSDRLAAIKSAGLVNHVEDVQFEDGDLAEAWTEYDLQFATVAMKWKARDYTIRARGGEVVEGRIDEVVTATEAWTFVRAPGGRWLLSAIKQI